MTHYWESPEAIEAYKSVGLTYQKTVWDYNYKQFLEKTRESPEELNQKIILNVRRVQSPFVDEKHNKDIEDEAVLSGEKLREYITCDMLERRVDALGNEHSFYRSNLGLYPIPIPRYRMTKDDMGYEKRVTAGTMGDRKGYSILFTKENVDKLLKKGGITSEDPKELAKQDMMRQQVASKVKAAINVRSANERTKFSVQIEGEQRKYSVHSFKDWKEGTFEELYNLGHANVTKDEWERLRAVRDVASAQRLGANQDTLDKVNDQIDKYRSGEELYK
jgi:hypothetical protein